MQTERQKPPTSSLSLLDQAVQLRVSKLLAATASATIHIHHCHIGLLLLFRRNNGVLYNNICYIVAGSWSAVEKWSDHVVPKCCRKGGWAMTLKRQRMVKKISRRKKWTTALNKCHNKQQRPHSGRT